MRVRYKPIVTVSMQRLKTLAQAAVMPEQSTVIVMCLQL